MARFAIRKYTRSILREQTGVRSEGRRLLARRRGDRPARRRRDLPDHRLDPPRPARRGLAALAGSLRSRPAVRWRSRRRGWVVCRGGLGAQLFCWLTAFASGCSLALSTPGLGRVSRGSGGPTVLLAHCVRVRLFAGALDAGVGSCIAWSGGPTVLLAHCVRCPAVRWRSRRRGWVVYRVVWGPTVLLAHCVRVRLFAGALDAGVGSCVAVGLGAQPSSRGSGVADGREGLDA